MYAGIAIGGSHHGQVLKYGAILYRVIKPMQSSLDTHSPDFETYYHHTINYSTGAKFGYWSTHSQPTDAIQEVFGFATGRKMRLFDSIDYKGVYERTFTSPKNPEADKKLQDVLDQEHIPGLFDYGKKDEDDSQ